MKNILMAAAVLLSMTYIGCKSEDEPELESEEVTIHIIEPAEGDTIVSGAMLHLEATFESESTIHHIGIYVIDEAMNDTLFSYEEHVMVDNYYEFHEHITPMVTETQTYKVEVAAWNMDNSIRNEEHVHVILTP
jgi:hypothetical protein